MSKNKNVNLTPPGLHKNCVQARQNAGVRGLRFKQTEATKYRLVLRFPSDLQNFKQSHSMVGSDQGDESDPAKGDKE